ncbi:lipid A-modifier LpxR family protein [Glycocaulis alkaliphilus]|uniref:lipid A-modifier LpxR family protein n=1 Tax=Glycocaulis alkaliphilus TaxID=1434191 RepID=UPI000FD9AA5C|nr:lipid A-modifier LpxR family protein [Glycocaulis alkaliphilus]GGB70496.1 hypothetical protein GCM10007417_07860 [Glycocaulis alkaliphilus]
MTTAKHISGRSNARAYCLAGAVALAGASLAAGTPAALAQDASSLDTNAIIIHPLLEELSAGPLPSMRLSMDRGEWVQEPHGARDATTLASSGLSATDTGEMRQSFGAFNAPQTVIARSAAGSELRVAMFDAEEPDWVTAALSPSGLDMPAWQFSSNRMRGRAVALRYEGRFDSAGGQGELDMGLRPRAGVSFGDGGSATEFGATVRVGRYVGSEDSANGGWWFFAGADRQALIYRPGESRSLRETLTLQPYAMVGDQQAGLAMRVQGVDVSLAYVRRETSWSLPTQSWDTSEDFAAFSLTWRR